MSEGQPRWCDAKGISDLSVAVDEIYALRARLAEEASIIEAHLTYKTFPRGRRNAAEDQIERMRMAARGDYPGATYKGGRFARHSLRDAGADECLTNHDWAEQRGLILAVERPDGDVQ